METRAAVTVESHKPFAIRELDEDEPGMGEVHVEYVVSGLCRSDLHFLKRKETVIREIPIRLA